MMANSSASSSALLNAQEEEKDIEELLAVERRID
jgi:hypothetical protein